MNNNIIHQAYLGLGSNLENPLANVTQAITVIQQQAGIELIKQSSCYKTKPVGIIDQPDFINAVILIKTYLSPHELLQTLLSIEKIFKRKRSIKNAPRTLDLDILLYDNLQLTHPTLTIPHPRMYERAFVLYPLAEIAPDLQLLNRVALSTQLECCNLEDIIKIV